MKLTCGTDLILIRRIEKSLRNPRFLCRVFSDEECRQLAARGFPPPTAAASFAAKEAFAKALGTGVRGFALREVSVLRDELGCPYYSFSGNALNLVQKAGLTFSLSLTHTEEHAMAFAVAYSE